MNKSPAKKLRKRLHDANPHCHWCGRLTVIFVGYSDDDSGATLDHIKSRFEAATYEEWHARENKVLACRKCNQDRNEAFLKANPRAIVRVDCLPRRRAMWARKAKLLQSFCPEI